MKSVAASLMGSSPLTRGKQKADAEALKQFGLIPAHAGKTVQDGVHAEGAEAHPRSRGENVPRPDGPPRLLGSSPLTRGKPTHSAQRPHAPGLIPAHAGKTRQPGRTRWRRPAHPRSRGENAEIGARTPAARGSSPLTRGKQEGGQVARLGLGLIPAHAGKTQGARPCDP